MSRWALDVAASLSSCCSHGGGDRSSGRRQRASALGASYYSGLRRKLAPVRSALRFAVRVLGNSLKARWLAAIGWRRCKSHAVCDPPEIERLRVRAKVMDESAEECFSPEGDVTGRVETLAEILLFCCLRDVGRCSAVSKDFDRSVAQDALWKEVCLRRWRGKQHSAHMRRWLSALDSRPAVEDLLVEYASDEQFREATAASAASSTSAASTARKCRVASWHDRYVFAERDAKRTAISREELCWDSPCADSSSMLADTRVFCSDCAAHQRPHSFVRRWAVAIHFERSFDLEAFFHDDGSFRDTGRFQDESAPWQFVYGAEGEVQVQILVDRPKLQPFRAERRDDDWSWRLISTGNFADIAVLSSRQLSASEHTLAETVPSHIVTLYMSRCPSMAGGPSAAEAEQKHVFGTWRCVAAYQGTMPAASWNEVELVLEPTLLTIVAADHQESYHCTVDEGSASIDLFEAGRREERYAVRGTYRMERSGRVLIAVRNQQPGGPRPTAVPDGIPHVDQVFPVAAEAVSSESRSSVWI